MGQITKLTAQDGHQFNAYTAGDETSLRRLIVVQEIFGLNGHIKSVVDKFAQEGFFVMAPALFDRVKQNIELGYTPPDIEQGLKARAQLNEEDVLADIQTTLHNLTQKDAKVGIIGYCWGGFLSWRSACLLNGLSAASCWYGGGIASAIADKPRCPVQMHFGEKDDHIPMAEVEAIKKAQPDVDVYLYKDAPHGFGCEARASYRPEFYQQAYERTLAFFAKHI